MGKRYCKHCQTLMTAEEYQRHFDEVLGPWIAERTMRGGMFVTIDGDEYWAPTVEEMQREGFRVYVKHYREWTGPWFVLRRLAGYGNRVKTKGGQTRVTLLAPDGYWAEGHAACSPKDVYSKKKGYVLAVNRALSELPGRIYAFDKVFTDALKEVTPEES